MFAVRDDLKLTSKKPADAAVTLPARPVALPASNGAPGGACSDAPVRIDNR